MSPPACALPATTPASAAAAAGAPPTLQGQLEVEATLHGPVIAAPPQPAHAAQAAGAHLLGKTETQPDYPRSAALLQAPSQPQAPSQQQVPATPSSEQPPSDEAPPSLALEAVQPTEEEQVAEAAAAPSTAGAAGAAAETPLLLPPAPPDRLQQGQPQQLHFVPDTAVAAQPFVPETAADVLLAVQLPPQFVPATAAEMTPLRQHPLAPPCFIPETAADVRTPEAPQPQPQCVPQAAADVVPLQLQHFVPETAADELPLGLAPPQAMAATAMPDVLPATASDDLPPQPGGLGLPGCMLSAAAGAAATAALAAAAAPPPEPPQQQFAPPPPRQQAQAQQQVQQPAGLAGGLGDFDVVIEAPAAAAATQGKPGFSLLRSAPCMLQPMPCSSPAALPAGPSGSGGFDYDLSQPTPSPDRRLPASRATWHGPGKSRPAPLSQRLCDVALVAGR